MHDQWLIDTKALLRSTLADLERPQQFPPIERGREFRAMTNHPINVLAPKEPGHDVRLLLEVVPHGQPTRGDRLVERCIAWKARAEKAEMQIKELEVEVDRHVDDLVKMDLADRWIPITESEPDYKALVLLYDEVNGAQIGIFKGNGFEYGGRVIKPTHWRELPAPPLEAPHVG